MDVRMLSMSSYSSSVDSVCCFLCSRRFFLSYGLIGFVAGWMYWNGLCSAA